jgi:hypothetical protein
LGSFPPPLYIKGDTMEKTTNVSETTEYSEDRCRVQLLRDNERVHKVVLIKDYGDGEIGALRLRLEEARVFRRLLGAALTEV